LPLVLSAVAGALADADADAAGVAGLTAGALDEPPAAAVVDPVGGAAFGAGAPSVGFVVAPAAGAAWASVLAVVAFPCFSSDELLFLCLVSRPVGNIQEFNFFYFHHFELNNNSRFLSLFSG
jgi:hypothetical protein